MTPKHYHKYYQKYGERAADRRQAEDEYLARERENQARVSAKTQGMGCNEQWRTAMNNDLIERLRGNVAERDIAEICPELVEEAASTIEALRAEIAAKDEAMRATCEKIRIVHAALKEKPDA